MLSDVKARIAGVTSESVVDGPGIRGVIYFQGCRHACPGCHNPETWDVNGGSELSLKEICQRLNLTPLVNGITLSGGEPFLQAEAAAKLAAFFRSIDLNLWVYTGFVWENLLANFGKPGYKELLEFTDVLVDGPYRENARDLKLSFRGSTNQRFIDVPKSLRTGEAVIWETATSVVSSK